MKPTTSPRFVTKEIFITTKSPSMIPKNLDNTKIRF